MQRRAILERMRHKTNQSHHFFRYFRAQFSSISPSSDNAKAIPLHQNEKKRPGAQEISALGILIIGVLVACQSQDNSVTAPTSDAAISSCGETGALETALFGSIETDIRWAADEMECDSMQRPNGEGLRVRFAGKVSDEILAIIIAMPALKPDEVGLEVPSNVTATVEGSGRFFSTPNLDSCWTEVSTQNRVAGQEGARTIAGTLFCIAPLGEVNGDASVSIPKLTFSTIVNWSAK
jgi:hypothetical protein